MSDRYDRFYRWHVRINEHSRASSHEHFMYEAKTAAQELPRLTRLFALERTGELPKVHQQCSHTEPVQLTDNKLTCSLGIETRACPFLRALDGGESPLSPEDLDVAKAWTCLAHILGKGGDASGEGYLLDESDKMFWRNTYASMAATDSDADEVKE